METGYLTIFGILHRRTEDSHKVTVQPVKRDDPENAIFVLGVLEGRRQVRCEQKKKKKNVTLVSIVRR